MQEIASSLVGLLVLLAPGCEGSTGPAPSPEPRPKPRALLQEARALGERGRRDEAIERLLAYREEHPPTLGVEFTLGTLLLAANRNEEAIACFEAELALKPDHVASWGMLGTAHERRGEYESVVECCTEEARLRPDDWRPPYRSGLVLRKYLHRLEEAERDLMEARRRNAGAVEPAVELGRLHMDQERLQEAEALFARLLRDHPENPEVHLHLGQLMIRDGRTEEGQELLGRFKLLAAERDRLAQLEVAGTAPTSCRAGQELLRLEKPRKALAAYQRACELDPADPCGHLGVARVKTIQGKYRDALASLARASKLSPGSFEVHYGSALALAGARRPEEAQVALRAARKLRTLSASEEDEVRVAFHAAGAATPGAR